MPGPNILFVMTDHTNAAAVAAGSPCLTPNLDGLAAGGVRFGRCHTTNAICSPARASLMTGTYPSTHGVWDCTHTQRAGWVDLPPARLPHFAMELAKAGYRNGYFGKWHVDSTNRLEAFGWHEYDIACSHARPTAIPGSEVRVQTPGYRPYRLCATAEDASVPSHPAFDRGLDFIRRHVESGAGTPFCCFISTSEPHDPYVPPKRFVDLYDPRTAPLSPTLRDEPEGKPEVVRRMRAVWSGLSDAEWRRVTIAYRACVTFLDSEVGRALAFLRSAGLDGNTIVVFTSDHGDMLGGHGLVAKGVGTPYEEVYTIPLVVRVPGMRGGREERAAHVSTVDVAPTLLDLCGLGPLPAAQGRSLRPLLDGSAGPDGWRDGYAEFYGQRFVYTQRIVWRDSLKYVFSPAGIDELYDLDADPHERVNLAADPQRRAHLLDMVGRMWSKMKEIGDDSLYNTQYATLRTAPVGPGFGA